MNNEGTLTRLIGSARRELEDKFKVICSSSAFDAALKNLHDAGSMSDRPSALAALYELLDNADISYEKDESVQYYKGLIDKAKLPDTEERMLLALYSEYEKYPTPAKYMDRLTERLSSEPFRPSDTTRVRILRQFVKHGNCLSDAGYKGKGAIDKYIRKSSRKPLSDVPADVIDDGIFSLLDNATKEQKKPNGTYGLLKAADDLAGGRFRTGGATKRLLYLYAIVFNMTYDTDVNERSIHKDTDIEKNLFIDYYTNNMMRFINSEYRSKLDHYELDPSGAGINYKNFAEIVYLYYLRTNYTASEKIRLAEEMIKRLQQKDTAKTATEGTIIFKNRIPTLLDLPEDRFEEYLSENYDCCTTRKKNSGGKQTEYRISPFEVGNSQHTAYETYSDLLTLLKNAAPLENCNYGVWFTDVAYYKKSGYDKLPAGIDDKDKFINYIEFLIAVNNFLGYTVSEKESRSTEKTEHKPLLNKIIKLLDINKPEEVTRTAIITAYYYYFNAEHVNESATGFGDFFNRFKLGVDHFLEQAGYQPFDDRNIFDVITAFSSYARLII